MGVPLVFLEKEDILMQSKMLYKRDEKNLKFWQSEASCVRLL
jgi:hypothetical protein